MRKSLEPILFALTLVTGCRETSTDPDGGVGEDTGSRGRICPVDDHSSAEKAISLTLTERFSGEDTYLCPPTDFDYFSFVLPAGQPLVTVELSYPQGSVSPVELSYLIYASSNLETPVTGASDQITTDNRSSVTQTHYLDPAGGLFYLVVRDEGNEDQDKLNAYGLTLTAAADPDPNEPNHTCATGKTITGAGTGAISAAGDRDAFLFNVPAGSQIVDVVVTNAEASPVDYELDLFLASAPDKLVAAEVDPRGDDGPSNVHMRAGIFSPGGTYCLIVKDDDDTEADREVTYSFTYQVLAETDPNEIGKKNDVLVDAIDVPRGGQSYTGDLNSKGDLDWFKVVANPGQVIEVRADCAGCALQLSVSYVYASEDDVPCGADRDCEFLMDSRSCTLPTDCESGYCNAVGDQRFCATSCGSRLDCPGLACQMSAGTVSACTGAAVCVPQAGRCGVLQYTENAENGSLATAQPAIKGTTYVLIHDFQDDETAPNSYSLDINVANDPDANESNNFYIPYTDVDAGDAWDRHRDFATEVAWVASGGRAVAQGRGCISYEGDVDVYRLVGGNPCGRTSSTAGGGANGNCGLTIDYDRPLLTGLDLAYFLTTGGGGGRTSFLASNEGTETRFGDATCGGGDDECAFYYNGDDDDYYFTVRDFGQDEWELDPAKCYTWRITSAPSLGCPASCPNVAPNNLCRCGN
ncbi:MAG: hypothetical protein HYV07_19705 [Deltaproteobacteria bacterium]|nr:hypothetical protein [Deltaproteobacteria bacterium]